MEQNSPHVKNAAKFALVLVTAPDMKTARALAKGALEAKLAACANLIPKIESHYWWQGKLERGTEALILFKTTKTKLAALEKHVLTYHPYATPEFLALDLAKGAERYLTWLAESV